MEKGTGKIEYSQLKLQLECKIHAHTLQKVRESFQKCILLSIQQHLKITPYNGEKVIQFVSMLLAML